MGGEWDVRVVSQNKAFFTLITFFFLVISKNVEWGVPIVALQKQSD